MDSINTKQVNYAYNKLKFEERKSRREWNQLASILCFRFYFIS